MPSFALSKTKSMKWFAVRRYNGVVLSHIHKDEAEEEGCASCRENGKDDTDIVSVSV